MRGASRGFRGYHHLIDEELLPLRRVEHLRGIARHERIEEGVEARGLAGTGLRPEDAAESLRLLPARPEVRRDLDDDVGVR